MLNINQSFPQLRVEPFGRSVPVSLSFLMHFAAVLIILRLPQVGATVRLNAPPFRQMKNTISYVVPVSTEQMVFAKMASAESGGAPGKGTAPGKPALGSSGIQRELIVVSSPVHPSNSHQLIIQPSSPPDLLIKQEIKLPNLILGNPLVMPREQVDIVVAKPKQMPAHRIDSADVASPPLPMPASKLSLAAVPAMEKPQLPVQAVPDPQTDPASKSASSAPGAGVAEGVAHEQRSLLALSTDPGNAKLVLPSGNMYGEFSVSPAGTHFGSPGGSGTVAIGGGSEGISAGGDGSTGVGHGKEGGGGKDSTGSPEIAFNGSGIAGGVYHLTIFPVPPDAPVRKNTMIISAGPAGGGGLGIYKALPCGRIFTIFLPMPVANWTLEYCTAGKSSTPQPRNGTTVQLEDPIMPPAPLQTFDFRRPPISKQNAPKNIILKGSIREDGSVVNLHVYQGIMREMDETARDAFNLWRFAPAMRAGKPVAVEILVGIPSLATN